MKKSIWEESVVTPEFESLSEDIKTDVLIIGGGICGILCAYFLKEAGIDCYAWTVDTIENANFMYKCNNHEVAIITNKPQLFFEY